MKNRFIYILSILAVSLVFFTSCSDDEETNLVSVPFLTLNEVQVTVEKGDVALIKGSVATTLALEKIAIRRDGWEEPLMVIEGGELPQDPNAFELKFPTENFSIGMHVLELRVTTNNGATSTSQRINLKVGIKPNQPVVMFDKKLPIEMNARWKYTVSARVLGNQDLASVILKKDGKVIPAEEYQVTFLGGNKGFSYSFGPTEDEIGSTITFSAQATNEGENGFVSEEQSFEVTIAEPPYYLVLNPTTKVEGEPLIFSGTIGSDLPVKEIKFRLKAYSFYLFKTVLVAELEGENPYTFSFEQTSLLNYMSPGAVVVDLIVIDGEEEKILRQALEIIIP